MNPSVPGPSSLPCWLTTSPKRCRPRSSNGSPHTPSRRCAGVVEKILPMVHRLTPELRLPLVSMVVPTLRRLSRDQFQAFAAGVRELIQADNQVSLYEYAFHRLILRHLAPHFGLAPAPRNLVKSADLLVGPVRHVLGLSPTSAAQQPSDAAHAFALGIQALGWPGIDSSLPTRNLDIEALDRALNELDAAAPPLKRQVLNACAASIGADGRVTLEEGELLRAIADALGCPIPPLQSLAGGDALERQSPGLRQRVNRETRGPALGGVGDPRPAATGCGGCWHVSS